MMNLVLQNLKRKDEQGIWYYDLHDDRHGMLLLEDMEHAMANSHVSRHTLVFTSKDEYSTLLNYLHEYKYDKRLVRERIRSCAWWYLHCVQMLEEAMEIDSWIKEEHNGYCPF